MSGCTATAPPTTVASPPSTTIPVPTTTDPATVGGSDFGPGPYRVEATVAVGESPTSIALDPETRTAYVARYVDGAATQAVSVLDTRTRTVTTEIPVGQVFPSGPQSIAVDSDTHLVYLVGGNSAGEVLVIDPGSESVTATIQVDGDPVAVVVDALRHTLYVANKFSRTVTVVDTVTRAVVATIPVDGQPRGLAIDPDTHHLWVVGGADVSVIDAATHAVSTTLRLGDDPAYIAIDPQTRTAYVTHSTGNSVSLIDTVRHTRTDSVSLGVRGRAFAAVVDPVAHTVYLSGGVFDVVTMIDTRTRAVTAARYSGITRARPYGSTTYGMAVDPVSHLLYVTNKDSGQIEVVAHE
ncbi:YncE family protein [Nocardia sp. SSK8]|uniref:YncE family protein n=1 Tax=Nocardia sp. SSK8 TaxID=3120154 RepID=UPI0030086938